MYKVVIDLAAPLAAECDDKDAMRVKVLKKWRSAGQNWANKCITVDAAYSDSTVAAHNAQARAQLCQR